MARGRDYSAYQQGIIRRYYEHRDDLAVAKLAELVSELYLVENDRKADALWRRAEKALAAMKIDPRRIETVVAGRDLDALASMVREAFGSHSPRSANRRSK